MSDRAFERAVSDWLDDGIDRMPKHAVEGVLLAVKTTPQERDLRIPWRFPMPAYARAIAAVAIVVIVGAGGLMFLNNQTPSGVGAAPPTASPSPISSTPSLSPSPSPEPVTWQPFTSRVYGYTLDYPEGWNTTSATRPWLPTDDAENGSIYSDQFGSDTDDVAFGVFQRPAGGGVDPGTVDGLKATAIAHCESQGLQWAPDCARFADKAESLCIDAGSDPCRPAIVLRSPDLDAGEEGTYAFVSDGTADNVIVLAAYRGESWPGTARFGGTSGLLRSVVESLVPAEP